MSYRFIKKLPLAEDIIRAYPLSEKGIHSVAQNRQEIKNILAGKDNRLLIVVGPCSAWPNRAVLDYADKLAHINLRLKQALKIVMRVYIQKPRTSRGWTGPVNQPDPFTYPDIEAGIRYTREMMVNVIEKGLPIADEALFTHNAQHFQGLLSWVAIGARSSEDQEHRIAASAMDCAVGLKNPTHGSLEISINSIIAAQHSHAAVFDGNEVETHGNPFAHLVLRGSNNQPNYSIDHLEKINDLMQKNAIQNPAVMIDVSHDNCLINGRKDASLQPEIISRILSSLKNKPALKKLVKGFMIESFLKNGCQKVDPENPSAIDLNGLSITDPCLDWNTTETVLLSLADKISHGQ